VSQAVQRVRMTFAKGDGLKYLSHLDLMRLWERAFRRAGVPLAYSQGFNPRPRISLAAPLPVGFTGRAEVMDILLEGRLPLNSLTEYMAHNLPPGIQLVSTQEVSLHLPSLPSQVRLARYVAWVEKQNLSLECLEGRVAQLLSAEELPRLREGGRRTREYDLRPLIRDLWLEGEDEECWKLRMCLHAAPGSTGRPEEVLAALGLEEAWRQIEREGIVLAGELGGEDGRSAQGERNRPKHRCPLLGRGPGR